MWAPAGTASVPMWSPRTCTAFCGNCPQQMTYFLHEKKSVRQMAVSPDCSQNSDQLLIAGHASSIPRKQLILPRGSRGQPGITAAGESVLPGSHSCHTRMPQICRNRSCSYRVSLFWLRGRAGALDPAL